jgi:hypothetical protein
LDGLVVQLGPDISLHSLLILSQILIYPGLILQRNLALKNSSQRLFHLLLAIPEGLSIAQYSSDIWQFQGYFHGLFEAAFAFEYQHSLAMVSLLNKEFRESPFDLSLSLPRKPCHAKPPTPLPLTNLNGHLNLPAPTLHQLQHSLPPPSQIPTNPHRPVPGTQRPQPIQIRVTLLRVNRGVLGRSPGQLQVVGHQGLFVDLFGARQPGQVFYLRGGCGRGLLVGVGVVGGGGRGRGALVGQDVREGLAGAVGFY